MLTKKHKALNLALAVVLVGLPVASTSSYVMLFAQDRYVTESLVAVKRVGEATSAPMGGLSALIGVNNTSIEDAQYLKEYIHSADMFRRLDNKLGLRAAFAGNGTDPIFQLPKDATVEQALKFYRNRVSVELDEKTYLLTLKTEGFDPAFSLKLNQEILSESDRFINEISQRVARDQVAQAEHQLQEASNRLTAAKEDIIAYQNTNKMFDPAINAETITKLVASLKVNLAELQTQERTLLSYLNPDTPQVVSIRSQIQSVEQQIAQEQAKLTSPSETKLNRQAVQFETLKSNVDFSVDLYKLALTALETSRLEAVRKMKSVIVISSPQLAQEALYPRRFYLIFSAFLISFLLYAIARLSLTVIRDHQD